MKRHFNHHIKRHKKRIQEIGGGLFLYESFNFLYDWILYPLGLAYWGLAEGALILAIGSLIQCGFLFWLYDKMRIDWLGAHALQELHSKENKNRFEHMAVWITKEKKTLWEKLISPIVFVALTLPIDPLIVALHYRKRPMKSVTPHDWGVLIAAVLSANLWWMVKIGFLVALFKGLVQYVVHAW